MREGGDPLPIINYLQGLENAVGDQAIFESVCEAALQEIPSLCPLLEEALENCESGTGERLAHTIKGAARAIAAERVMAIAEAIEKAMAGEDLEDARRRYKLLTPAIEDLKLELTKHRS